MLSNKNIAALMAAVIDARKTFNQNSVAWTEGDTAMI